MATPADAPRVPFITALAITGTLVLGTFAFYWTGLTALGLTSRGDELLPPRLVVAVVASLTLTASMALWRVSPWLARGRLMRAAAALVVVVAALLPFLVLALRAWRWIVRLPPPLLLLGLGLPLLSALLIAPILAALAPVPDGR